MASKETDTLKEKVGNESDASNKRVVYIVSQELAKISSLLPSNKKRSLIVHSLINALGIMSPDFSKSRHLQAVTPRRASSKDLAVYHTRDYLAMVLSRNKSNEDLDANCTNDFGLEDDCPLFPGLCDYVQLVGGATLTAVTALQQKVADIAICWDGGRHHARKDQASGFCYVADCILAILALKRSIPPSVSTSEGANHPPGEHCISRRKPRIMYLDLDLHFSDAVSEAFYSPTPSSGVPQILTLSFHHTSPGFFPASSPRSSLPPYASASFDPCTLSIPLKQGASAPTFFRLWPIVERIKKIFSPDYIILQCGVDGLAGDPCATFNWCLDREVEGSMGWCIERVIREWEGRKLLLGGGGYNSPNAARAWAYLTSIALESPLDLEKEIPDHAGFPLYAPSFTLDVPAGNMIDHNTDEYLSSIEMCYENVYIALRSRMDV